MRPQGVEATGGDLGRQELLEREILEIAEREKERLSRELHDGLCQSLAGIAALASALTRSLAANAEAGPAAAAGEIVRLLNEAIGEARDLARGLGAIDVSGAGLRGALEALARNVSHAYSISCTFVWDSRWPKLRHETEGHLVRITQEAVRNAVTHGRADQINISLECVDGSGLLSIRDNGVGLSEDYRNRDGIGLRTMDYRAHAIGGSLAVAPRPDRGTVVACAFRLPATVDVCESPIHARCPA
jgi:signal transduction histidine kinase